MSGLSPSDTPRAAAVTRAIVGRSGHGDRDVIVTAAADTPIRDIAVLLEVPGAGFSLDETRSSSSTIWGQSLSVDGSLLHASDGSDAVTATRTDVTVGTLTQRAGLSSGGVVALGAGRFSVGEVLAQDSCLHVGPVAEPALWCDVRPQGAALFRSGDRRLRGTIVRADTAAFSFEPFLAERRDEPSPDVANLLVSRPPRHHEAAASAPIKIAEAPPPVPSPIEFSWAAFLAPIPIGLLMAVLFRPLFALFALMGPVTILARMLESRRRRRRAQRIIDSYEAAVVRDLRPALSSRVAAVARHRRWCQPTAADLFRHARCREPRLWERRPTDDDFLTVSLGLADEIWEPEFVTDPPASAQAVIDNMVTLRNVPMVLDLREGVATGVVGERVHALALARSLLLQLVTLHGPADLRVHLVCDEPRTDAWDWCKWLPHVSAAPLNLIGSRAVAVQDRAAVQTLVQGIDAGGAASSSLTHVVIVDTAELMTGADSTLREVVQRRDDVHAIVIGDTVAGLPAQCDHIVGVAFDAATLSRPADGGLGDAFLPEGVTDGLARDWARSLAPLVDSEVADAASSLPNQARLLELRGEPLTPRAVVAGWERNHSLTVPLGLGSGGPVDVDLAVDGPHALVAGTTGSGKSELLRSLVAGLALERSSRDVNLVLIDFKGGGAFDACADLPHVVAVVTDLDDHLAGRALRSLQAEIRRREVALRDSSSSDIGTHNQRFGDPASPERLARLVVIIDEFATLAAELPNFLDALVDIAQRGRSLGLHLVLATQRPAGVVDQKIRANTNLRIALRVQDTHDSADVIGVGLASGLNPRCPGRAYVRSGGGEPELMQSALVTGSVPTDDTKVPLRILPFRLEGVPAISRVGEGPEAQTGTDASKLAATDLDRIVAVVNAADATFGLPAPHQPWMPPLPLQVSRADLAGLGLAVGADHPGSLFASVGLIDIPEEQRRDLWLWRPAEGSLLVYGIDDVLAAQAIATIAIDLATHASPEQCHLYLVGALGDLDLLRLPHVGAVIEATDTERVKRLVDRLHDQTVQTVEAVQAVESVQTVQTVLMIENYAAVADALTEAGDMATLDRLGRLLREGPSRGVAAVLGARNERAIPLRIASQVGHRLVGRMADPASYTGFGLRASDVPALPPHRVIDLATGQLVQLAVHEDGAALDELVASRIAEGGTVPGDVAVAPGHVSRIEMAALLPSPGSETGGPQASRSRGTPVPVGIDAATLDVSFLDIVPGRHLLVSGPRSSGRTTMLLLIAHGIREAHDDRTEPPLLIWVGRDAELGPASDRFDRTLTQDAVATSELDAAIASATGSIIVLVDDAEEVEPGPDADVLRALVSSRSDQLTVIAAATPDFLRRPGVWVQPMRTSRSGVMLAPTSYDSDIFRVSMPSVPDGAPQGRGVLIRAGVAAVTQFADLV